MLVMPLSYANQNRLANDVNTILSKIRRGCALARQDSQNNPPTNMMVDLPEGIDFEIVAISSYQNSTFQREVAESTSTNNASIESVAGLDSLIGSSQGSGSGSGLSSRSLSKSSSESSEDSSSKAGSENQIESLINFSNSTKSASEASSGSEGSSALESGIQQRSEYQSESSSKISSQSGSENNSKSESRENSASESGSRAQRAGNGRGITSFEDETGEPGPPLAIPAIVVGSGGTSCT